MDNHLYKVDGMVSLGTDMAGTNGGISGGEVPDDESDLGLHNLEEEDAWSTQAADGSRTPSVEGRARKRRRRRCEEIEQARNHKKKLALDKALQTVIRNTVVCPRCHCRFCVEDLRQIHFD